MPIEWKVEWKVESSRIIFGEEVCGKCNADLAEGQRFVRLSIRELNRQTEETEAVVRSVLCASCAAELGKGLLKACAQVKLEKDF